MKKSKQLVWAALWAGMLFFSGCRTCGCPMAEGSGVRVEIRELPPLPGFFWNLYFVKIAALAAILIV
jgi:hypothetical protein